LGSSKAVVISSRFMKVLVGGVRPDECD